VPVGARTSRREVFALASAAAGVAIAVAIGWAMLRMAGTGEVTTRLGDDVFDAGRADRIAAEIDQRGPALYSDVAGGERDIVLQHLGDDATTGWYAFAARPEGAPRDCYVDWRPDAEEFRDVCSGEAFPPDGEGLEQFPVRVEGGRVVVDIKGVGERQPPATSPPDTVVRSGAPAPTTAPPTSR
jgi:hypothetical protein